MYHVGKTANKQNAFEMVYCNQTKRISKVTSIKFKRNDFGLLELLDWVAKEENINFKSDLINYWNDRYEGLKEVVEQKDIANAMITNGREHEFVSIIFNLYENKPIIVKEVQSTTSTLSLTPNANEQNLVEASVYKATILTYVGTITKKLFYSSSGIMQKTQTLIGVYTHWVDTSNEYKYVDYLGRIKKEIDSHGKITNYHYDTYGNMMYVEATGVDGKKIRYEYTYDSENDETKERIIKTINNGITSNFQQSLPTGTLTGTSIGDESEQGTIKNFEYDPFFNPTKISVSSDIILATTIQYENGLLSSISSADASTYRFQYDTFGRLKLICGQTDNETKTVTYNYEEALEEFCASPSVANIKQINDGYNNMVYSSKYDKTSGMLIKQTVTPCDSSDALLTIE